jgi:hypothetical protein
VDAEKHRAAASIAYRRCPHIEDQAVLALVAVVVAEPEQTEHRREVAIG